MKYLIGLFIGLVFTMSSFAQTTVTEYPKIETDSTGQVLVTMTIEQAQKLDNAADLLVLFEKMNTQLGSYDDACVKVVNDQQQVIATQKIQISKLKSQVDTKSKEILNLQSQIENYKKDLDGCNLQNSNKDKIISDQKNTIKKQKNRMIAGGSIGGVVIIALTILLIL